MADLAPTYGTRENIVALLGRGAIPDPYFLREDIDFDLDCRRRRGEKLPSELEEMRSVFGLSEPLDH